MTSETIETDIQRDMTGETVCGFRVAAWRETHPEHGDSYGHRYSEHWSTPSQNPEVTVERLFTETQLRAALSRAPEVEDLGSSTRPTSPASRPQTPLSAGWRHIDSAPSADHMRPILVAWRGRGVCETYWDVDEDYPDRPKGWRSPEVGWRSPGDQCIPVNQEDCTHWMPLPEPPAEEDLSGAQRSELTRLAQDEHVSSPPSTGGEKEDLEAASADLSRASSSQTLLSDGWGDRPQEDTPWVRGDVEKPIYDGYGERFLLTWCTRSGTYDIGCIDGNWTAGEAIDTSRGELWRWLDVNPERHLPADTTLSGPQRSEEALSAQDEPNTSKLNIDEGLLGEGDRGLARSLPSGDAQERSPAPPLSDGWRVKDFAGGWIHFATGDEALAEVAAMGGALVEPSPQNPDGGRG